MLKLLAAIVASTIHFTDTALLTVSKTQQSDGLVILVEDATQNYRVTQIEAASLDPFCLALVVATNGNNIAPSTLWKECVTAGRLIKNDADLKSLPVAQGGAGKTIILVASSPVSGSNLDLKVLAKFAVLSEPIPSEVVK